MKIGSRVALSIVACGMLCEGQSYNDWNQAPNGFQGGDTVNISFQDDPSKPSAKQPILTSSIALASGTLTATVNIASSKNTCGIVACLNSATTFGSTGASLIFNVTGGTLPSNPSAFDIKNGGSLTVDANIKVSGTIPTRIFNVAGNGNLTFNGDVELSGAGTAIAMNGGSLNINQASGKKVDITGNINASGGSTTIKLDDGDKIQGNFTGNGGNSNLTLDIDASTYTGNVTNAGTSTVNIKNNGKLEGKLTTSGTSLNLTMDQGTITNGVTSTATTNTISLTNGSSITAGGLSATGTTNNLTIDGNSTIGDISLTTTSTSSGANTITVKSGKLGNVTLSSTSNVQDSNKIVTNNGSTINKVSTTGAGGLSFLLQGNSSVTNGIHTSAQSTKVDIAAVGNSKINGTSELAGADEVRLVFKEQAGAGTLNFKGVTNNLIARANTTQANINAVTMQGTTNQVLTENASYLTIGSLEISGQTNDIAEVNGGTVLQNDGANLTITGNASVTATNGGNNKLAFGKGNIGGSLTTKGNTDLYTLNGYEIKGGVRHANNGNFTATMYGNSQISNGIQTSGTGNATVDLKNSSKINGDSNFSTQTNTVTLETSAQINGNITFSNNSTLTANNNSKIDGQVITRGGTATYTFNTSSILDGGIDTNQGAGKTTATFSDNSKLQNGISNFNSNIDITFANTSKAINETFNVQAGTANITFKDNAEMQGGSINNNGGNANILFENQAKMTNNGSINTTNGTTKLDAKNSANLTGSITQSGGTFTANFNDNSQFNGNATQTGGTSNITFKDNAKWTGNFSQTGGGSNSTITFHGSANMKGNITTNNGKTNITFDQKATIVGDIKAQGTQNRVTFTDSLLKGNLTLDGLGTINGNSNATLTKSQVTGNIQGYDKVDITIDNTQVDGYLHQGGSYNPQGMKATITNSHIKGGFEGNNAQTNTLKVTNSKIDGGVKQNKGFLNADFDQSVITGGFSGTGNSKNTVTMNKGSLTGGISQDTGSLDFTSDDTSISGGFKGTNSTNTMSILRGDFNNGDITQTRGSLRAELLGVKGLQDFKGTNSANVVQLSKTASRNISQSGGSLEFSTQDGNVTGSITGTNGSQNKINITGANVAGTISQNTGSMILTTANAEITGAISSSNATFELSATSTKASSVTLTDSTSTGISSDLTLTGTFTQTRGTSTMTFSNTKFTNQDSIKFKNTTSASLIFTKSDIKNVSATSGTSTLNLSNSQMGNFTGTNGNHTVMLTTSTGGGFSQNGGSLAVSGAATSTITSLAGTNSANITLNLNATSKVTGNVTNQNGNTSISLQNSTIGGSVEQTGGNLTFTADRSEVTGHYKQTGGGTSVNFSHSSIKGGVDLSTVTAGSTLTFSQDSEVDNGFKVTDSTISLSLLSKSKITGGFSQTRGNVTGSLDDSSISGNGNTTGLTLENGTTNFTLYNGSSINDGIKATNNTTTILVDNSQINGNITIERGSLDLTAQNKSTITSAQMKVTDADLKLTLDTTSKFIGDLSQINNNQTIIIKQDSTFQGNITNTDTTGTITITNAELTGSITQNGGILGLDLSNGGKIGQDVTLTGANTTLSGSGANNSIGGNFSQSNGTLTGSMNGLTLTGTYSQNGGTSDVSFTNSAFNSNTTITTATSSSLTFDHSTLKGYTIDGGTNNTLKLLNGSTMNGTLTLQNQATATLKMQDSTIKGNIDASGNSTLNFNTANSEITGTTTINTGGLTGTADNTKFGGSFTLTSTTSDVSFVNGSSITGNLTATGAGSNNVIKFDDSSITGSVSQTGGNINFDLSNGSSIGTDLTFKNANAHFTGSGAGNSIAGNFLSENTTLTGDVSGLTLTGTFTQNQGTSDITFRNESNFNGAVSITNATSSNINFENQSGIKANIEVKNGNNNNLSFNTGSYIEGNTTLTNTTATITANDNSTIAGNLTSENSTATVTLDASTFEGNITQNNNSLTLTGANGSTFTSNAFNIAGNGATATTNVNLNTGSNLSAGITANNATLGFSLNNASSVDAVGNPSTINLTDSTLTITAQNGSTFNANITDNGNAQQPFKTANISLEGGSAFNGTLSFTNIDVTASFNGSTLNSDSITAINGKFDLSYTNSPNGGVITKFTATDTKLNIKADNSTAFINELTISGNTLNLLAENNARLTIRNLELDNNTKATYTARTNGNLNVNTNLKDNASTLEVNLAGGMLQGTITQNKNGNAFNTGNVKLETMGDFGGRLAPTDDMQIKSLTLNNDEQILQSNALFASVFNNPMSYVDFTLEFDDTDTSSRVGKALIVKPQPQPNQPIPPAPDGSTYVRQLQVDSIDGNHGLFRVYADLGANLADNILAQKASGDHIIQVQYRAATFSEAGGNDIVVAKVTDPTTSVSFKGTQSEVGLTRYDTEIIKRNANGGGFEWIIGQITQAGMSYSSKIIATLLQSQYRNFMVEVDSLDRRMGDLRYIKRDLGVWMRAYVGEATKAPNDFSVSSTDNYYSVWAGVDFNSIGLTVHNFAGMFFNYTGINSESKDFKGSGYNIGVGFYDTFKAFSGFYADFLIKYIYSSTSFDISNYALAKNKPEIDNHKFLLNAEVGYTFYYGEKFKSGYIEPQFQVTSGYIDQASLEVVDVSGEKIYATMARNFPITMRAGVFWGQVFGEKIKSHIKLGSSFAYDVNSGGDLHFQDSSTQLNFKQEGDFRMLLSAQTDFTFSDFFKLYASIDTSFFGDYNITYSANFGLRMTFGRANNRVANVPIVYNPYEPPVAINDDRRTVPVVKRFTTKDIDQNYVGKNRKVQSQIRGNPTPAPSYGGAPTYTPSRKSIRDITSEVSF